jgi:hypothetical protein
VAPARVRHAQYATRARAEQERRILIDAWAVIAAHFKVALAGAGTETGRA